MKRFILFIFLVVVFAVLAAPFIEGYWFKQLLSKRITAFAEQLQPNAESSIKLEIAEYHLGWLTSTAVVTMTATKKSMQGRGGFQMPPIVFKYELQIHHGPIVFVDSQPRLAMANVETNFFLPDIIKAFIPDNGNGFMQAQTLVSLDKNTFSSTIKIPGQDFLGMAKWDGMSGNATFVFANDNLVKVDSQATVGALITQPGAGGQVVIEPVSIQSNTELMPSKLWGGTHQASTAGIGLQGPNNKSLIIYDLKSDTTYGDHGSLYDVVASLSLGKVSLPPTEVVNTLSGVNLSLAVKNLNASALYELTSAVQSDSTLGSRYAELMPKFFKIFTPDFNVTTTLTSATNLGNAKIDLAISFVTPPTSGADFNKNINATLNARIARALVEAVVTQYVTQGMVSSNRSGYQQGMQSTQTQPTPADLQEMTKYLIMPFIQKKYVLLDNNDYVVALVVKGESFMLNGVDVTQSVMQLQQHGMTGFGLSPQKDYYVQIVSATAPYRVAVNECAKTLGTIVGCNAGSNRIPAAITTPTGTVSSLTVVDGVITVAPVEANGVLATDTYVLTPSLNADGSIIWIASGPGVMKGYAR